MVTPLTLILLQCHQECERMNILVGVIVRTLSELCLAYKARQISERQIHHVRCSYIYEHTYHVGKGGGCFSQYYSSQAYACLGFNGRSTSDGALYPLYIYLRQKHPKNEGSISLPLQKLAMHYNVLQGDLTMTEQLEELQLAVSTDKVDILSDWSLRQHRPIAEITARASRDYST